MRLLHVLVSAFAVSYVTSAILSPRDGPTLPLLGDYASLYAECAAGGPDTYVSVQYDSGRVKTYQYGECLKYNLPSDGLAQNMVFCKPATCYDYPYSDCTGGQVLPVKIPVLPGTVTPNALNWYSLFGKSGVPTVVLPT